MRPIVFVVLAILALLVSGDALAHNVSPYDANLIAGKSGPQVLLYPWLGAKHMVTGYDHLLFLVGVILYLRSVRAIAIFVSLFALGHSVTLISGVLLGLDGFGTLFGESPDEKAAVFIFGLFHGLFHGLGLATKLQDLGLADNGLLMNLISFNVGVEIGQLAALIVIVMVLRLLPPKTETITIDLELDAVTEYKALMQQGDAITFRWTTDGNDVYYDFHAHDESFGPQFFTRFDEGEGSERAGSILAPYAGQHGWFFMNLGDTPTTITLEVSGFYDEIIEIDLEGG